MATLHDGFILTLSWSLAHFLLIQTFDLPIPLLLNDCDDIALILGLENGEFNLDGALFVDHRGRLAAFLFCIGIQPIFIVANDLGDTRRGLCGPIVDQLYKRALLVYRVSSC